MATFECVNCGEPVAEAKPSWRKLIHCPECGQEMRILLGLIAVDDDKLETKPIVTRGSSLTEYKSMCPSCGTKVVLPQAPTLDARLACVHCNEITRVGFVVVSSALG